ncbi:hypothetical protein Tco_0126409, partial [Tanacetum coccineum]
GIACDKDGDKFEFGKMSGSKGSTFGHTILSNQYSADAERFAEKLKKG